ncbi:AC4 protein [Ocimum yellow vein virus]|uniref:AC4 protein n=1 Tax=Ocimum yellow vein virus TaxID=2664942 RepID=A0A5Q0TS96_9GEMI|nr:AC4 protein [Ocimum yellow vein virus]QGA69862.1 AC4 protein [Ocimum yellow vein virus]
MGNLTSIFSFNSKANSHARITDSSILRPQAGDHITIRTFRELNQARTLNHTSRRTAIHSNGENSR